MLISGGNVPLKHRKIPVCAFISCASFQSFVLDKSSA
jgi:hypothetical protein